MNEEKIDTRGLTILAYVNVSIWSLAIIALVFVINRYPGAKGLFPILAGGSSIGVILISRIQHIKKAIEN